MPSHTLTPHNCTVCTTEHLNLWGNAHADSTLRCYNQSARAPAHMSHASPPFPPCSKDAVQAAHFLARILPDCVKNCLTNPKQLHRLGGVDLEQVVQLIMSLLAVTANLQHWWVSALEQGQDPVPLLEGLLLPALQQCLHALAKLMDQETTFIERWKPLGLFNKSQDNYFMAVIQDLWALWLNMAEQVRWFVFWEDEEALCV